MATGSAFEAENCFVLTRLKIYLNCFFSIVSDNILTPLVYAKLFCCFHNPPQSESDMNYGIVIFLHLYTVTVHMKDLCL